MFMKKVFCVITLIMLYGICMAKTKIISSAPCEYRNVSCDFFGYEKWFKEEISYRQALEDLDTLIYLLKNAYSGYEDAVKRGLETDRITESFKKSFSEGQNIKASDLSQFLYDFLNPYIQDFHFFIESKDFGKNLITVHRILYSNIYVRKVCDNYIIEKSDDNDFRTGETLSLKSENLFLYPSEGEKIFRVGSYATFDEKEKQIPVNCRNNERLLSCNIENNYVWSSDITSYKEIETKDSLYIYIPTLQDIHTNDNRKAKLDENFKKLHSVSERYPQKKNIILDLRTNHGGNSLHTSKFLANLYFAEKNCTEKNTINHIKKTLKIFNDFDFRIDLISPPIVQAENCIAKYVFFEDKLWIEEFNKRRNFLNNQNLRITYSENKKIKPKSANPKFNGKLVILSGKNTCSSGELAIVEAKKLFPKTNQIIQLGENTAGCFAYGNVWCYQLPNSGIAMHLPSFVWKFEECPEGFGLKPDYWSTNEDILNSLVQLTGDTELTERLADINSNL